MSIKIKSKNGCPSINGIICTYDTKKIRSEIQDFFEANKTFKLPSKFTYEIRKSKFHGFVAKIIIKQLADEEIREPIQNALYATGNFSTDRCDTLTLGILDYLHDSGFEVVKRSLMLE